MTAPYKKPEINMTKLLCQIPNKFLLCVAASRRARQLKDIIHNEGILEEIPTVPVLDALKEIMDGNLTISLKAHVEDLSNNVEAKIAEAKAEKIADSNDDKKGKDAKSSKKNKSLAA